MSDDRRAEVFATVKKLVLDIDDSLAPERIVDSASFMGDLNFDSLQVVEMTMELEEQFDLEIPEEEAEGITTVGQAVDYIVAALAAQEG
ncbi:MAG: acyl carrier protein [Armatimonadota bacterium]